jgi:multidrug efflux system membrane fusion protein
MLPFDPQTPPRAGTGKHRLARDTQAGEAFMRLTSLLFALLLAGGLYWWFALRAPLQDAVMTATEAPPPAETVRNPPVEVVVLESRAEPVVNTLTLRGRTVPNRRVVVTAETEGLVVSEPRRKGARVAEGDLLCRIDPGARPALLQEARAKLAEARIEAEAAQQLSAKGFAPETTRTARMAALEAAQARVEQMELDIARLAIHAPFAGTLEEDAAELGARLGIGDPCATVVDLASLKVAAYVSELEVDQVAPGRRATARLVNGQTAEGRISYVSPVADPETRTFEVEVTLPNEDGRLRAGMTAEIDIALPALEAHRIPQSALTLDDAGRLGVRTAEDGTARFWPVSLVREAPDAVWVTGLPGTAQVIVAGQEFVTEGRAVVAVPLGESALR